MFSTNRITRHLALVVVIISSGVMGYIIYELSITKKYFAQQLIEQTAQQLERDLDNFFDPVKNIMLTLKRQQVSSLLDEFDTASLIKYYIPIIEQYPQISSIGFAFKWSAFLLHYNIRVCFYIKIIAVQDDFQFLFYD